MKKITTCLWFDRNAEEAARFYVSVFKNSKVGKVSRYGKACEGFGQPPGTVMTVEFELNGQPFVGLNGGPMFKFNEAVSFQVICETQDEIDDYWAKLSQGSDEEAQRCGWLKDRFGLSWQIVPTILSEIMQGKDAARSDRVMMAMLGMKKLELNALQQACDRG